MPSRIARISHVRATLAVVDKSGVIVGVNDRWKRFARENGLTTPNYGVGQSYLSVAGEALGREHEFVRSLSKLLDGQIAHLTWVYPCHSPQQERWFNLIGLPFAKDDDSLVILMHMDITDLAQYGLSAAYEQSRSSPTSGPSRSQPRSRQGKSEALRRAPGISAKAAWSIANLTTRETAVLECLERGLTNEEIAEELGATRGTVKVHVRSVLRKLGVNSRAKAAVIRRAPE